MKPPPFGYSRPESVAEAVATLDQLGTAGKVLAGGQSLVPLLSMRLAAPAHLVDINQLTDLAYVRVEADVVRVGALARQTQVLADAAAALAQPLLGQAVRLVAHATVRNRGTVVGSLVHADPSAEMTAVLALLGGAVRLTSARAGDRTVSADRFFLGPLESALRPGELALEALFPRSGERTGSSFVEVARRQGDYAVCGVAAVVAVDGSGQVSSARTAYLSVASTPVVLDLSDTVAGQAGFGPAADAAMGQLHPESDIHASAQYRRHLVGVLTGRALDEAYRAAAGAASRAERGGHD